MTRIPVLMAFVILAAAGAPAVGNAQAGGQDSTFFDKADTDGDGSVSRKEYIRGRSAHFDALDRNGDGVVSTEDFPVAERHPEAAQRLDERIAEADTNQDGKVTREELEKAPIPLFERADTDDDGAVSRAEREALRGR